MDRRDTKKVIHQGTDHWYQCTHLKGNILVYILGGSFKGQGLCPPPPKLHLTFSPPQSYLKKPSKISISINESYFCDNLASIMATAKVALAYKFNGLQRNILKMCMSKYYSDTISSFRNTNKKLTKNVRHSVNGPRVMHVCNCALFDAEVTCDWDEGGRLWSKAHAGSSCLSIKGNR